MKPDSPVPPEELRLGIGPFSDPKLFIESGFETVQLAERLAGLKPDHTVLDIGCGCGRVALPLRSYLSNSGRYLGFDLNRDYIEWCKSNIAGTDNRFQFVHYDLVSASYNPDGIADPAELELSEHQSFDLAILSSVFTHMYPGEIENYLDNLYRVLVPGGRALVSALLMNPEAADAVRSGTTIFDFSHRVGDSCWTFEPERPLAGISCDMDWLIGLCREAGFGLDALEYGNWRKVRSYMVQHDWFVLKKPAI